MEAGEGGGEKSGDVGGEKRDIRRPMNAFLIFCKRHRSMVREKHPDRDNRSVTRILGDLWANLPDDEKAVYTNLAKTYKDAFMKANPDYKWHSTDRLPQPAKMATRPTNVRPPRSLSTSDASPLGHCDGDKMGGVNLLLLAGKQSMPIGDQLPLHRSLETKLVSSDLMGTNSFENKIASPDLMGANSALLQLAEMCSSSELAGRHSHMDSAALRSAPPKKRARHWSHSDVLHTDVADKNSLPPTTVLFHSNTHITKPLPPPVATHTSQSETVAEKLDHSYHPSNQYGGVLQRNEAEQLSMFKRENQTAVVQTVPLQLKEEKGSNAQPQAAVGITRTEPFNMELGIPPKKKFTKLHDRYKGDRPAATTTATSTESGCLSDQNDNAIFTCGKLVVDHIIDRLFSANLTSSEHHDPVSPSSTDIEKVRKIITADITEREKLQGPSSKEMGKLLSEVVQKPQNLVEKVIEEAYNMDLKRIVKQDLPRTAEFCLKPASIEETESKPNLVARPVMKAEKFSKLEPILEQTGPVQPPAEMKHDMATMVTTAPLSPFHTNGSNGEPTQASSKAEAPAQPAATTDQKEERFMEEMVCDTAKEDGTGDYMPDEEEGYLQPVRKSRRRNRGQRYQELINEGIIQPSKERLAARRHEQVPPSVPINLSCSLYMGEDMSEDDVAMADRPRQGLKRSNSELEQGMLDDKRYRTGDFDLEAEIATLPPCSLDQVPRRRGPRKRSDSESGRRPPGSPSQVKDESSSPEHSQWPTSLSSSLTSSSSTAAISVSQPAVPAGPLTGSQKRKARKHSINRLVASTDSGSKAKPPGIEAAIPMVRDATVSPVRNIPSSSATSTSESSASATSSSEFSACATSVSTTCLSPVTATGCYGGENSVPSIREKLFETANLQESKGREFVNSGDLALKTEVKFTAEKERYVEERKTLTTEQRLAGLMGVVQTSTVSVDAGNVDAIKNSSMMDPESEDTVDKAVAKSISEESRSRISSDSFKKDGDLKANSIVSAAKVKSEREPEVVKKSITVSGTEVKSCAAVTKDTEKAVVVTQIRDPSLPVMGVVSISTNQVARSSVFGENPSAISSADTKGCGTELTHSLHVFSPEGGAFSKNFTKNSGGGNENQARRWQLKETLSSDSGQYSSLDVCEDMDRETTPDEATEEDKRHMFLSETSGLLCVTHPPTQKSSDQASVLGSAVSERKKCVSQSSKSSLESASDSEDQGQITATPGLIPFEDQDDAIVEDSALSSIVAMGVEDSMDDGDNGDTALSSESLDHAEMEFSPFSSGATTTTGPRVTTVTMTTTDAMPTALSLEMMEEEGMVDSGMGNPMLCGSPMPESPSVTVVHS